jgi:hypothetical protein
MIAGAPCFSKIGSGGGRDEIAPATELYKNNGLSYL